MGGALGISIIIVAFLLVCTSLGHPLKRRLLRLGAKSSEKSGEFNNSELETHTFEFRSPHPPGSPAPPYEWVLRITPPPPPTAHFPSIAAHISPSLTHRFSDTPRDSSGHGLGIQTKEDLVEEKQIITKSSEKADNLHPRSPLDCTETNRADLVSNPVQILSSRPLSVADTGAVAKAAEVAERQARHDRYRALLLQSDEKTRQNILKSMSEEDRAITLKL